MTRKAVRITILAEMDKIAEQLSDNSELVDEQKTMAETLQLLAQTYNLLGGGSTYMVRGNKEEEE